MGQPGHLPPDPHRASWPAGADQGRRKRLQRRHAPSGQLVRSRHRRRAHVCPAKLRQRLGSGFRRGGQGGQGAFPRTPRHVDGGRVATHGALNDSGRRVWQSSFFHPFSKTCASLPLFSFSFHPSCSPRRPRPKGSRWSRSTSWRTSC